MDNKNILIRLLKEGHISEIEFKSLYEGIRQVEVIDVTLKTDKKPIDLQKAINDFDWVGVFRENWQIKDGVTPEVWHGTNHPTTGDPLGPTYSATN